MSRETYWKRRALVLAVFLLLVAVIAYACSPSVGEETGQQNQAGAGGDDTEASPSVPPEDPSAGADDEDDGEDDDADPSEDPSEAGEDTDGDGDSEDGEGSDPGSGDGGEAGSSGADIPAPERPEDACRPQDVVVTFDFENESSDEPQYASGVNPSFTVEVVNTGEQTCTVDVGPEELAMVVTSGDDSVYSTAHCREGDTSDERQLDQGRTHSYVVDWDRERSFSDCREKTSVAGSGWYHAELSGTYSGDTDTLRFRIG